MKLSIHSIPPCCLIMLLFTACGGEVDFGEDNDLDPSLLDASMDRDEGSRPDLGAPYRPEDMSLRDAGASPSDLGPSPTDLGTTQEDMPGTPRDMGVDPPVDMGSGPPDMMDPPPVDMGQPPIGPPPSPSVETVLNQGCTTTIVKGLSEQLIEEMNCIDPGVVSSFAYLQNLNLYAAVFPFLLTPSVQALDATVSGQNTLTISSALRTVPQQYLLYRWYQQGRCSIGLAAQPGRSNHNGAKAIDTPDYSAWKSRFQANNWVWLGSNDPVHYTFNGGKDIRALSVLAFQKLWNRNNPNDLLTEDSDYGPNTEAKLKLAPSNGFAIPPWCPSSRSYREHATLISPTVRLMAMRDDSRTLEIYAPSVVHEVRYALDDVEITLARNTEVANFQVTLPVSSSHDLLPLDVTTFEASGERLRTTQAMLPGKRALSMMPEGAGIYRIHHAEPLAAAHHMSVYVDGALVPGDPTSMESGSPFDLMLSLRPYRDDFRARHVEVTLEDAWGNRIEHTAFDLMVTY